MLLEQSEAQLEIAAATASDILVGMTLLRTCQNRTAAGLQVCYGCESEFGLPASLSVPKKLTWTFAGMLMLLACSTC